MTKIGSKSIKVSTKTGDTGGDDGETPWKKLLAGGSVAAASIYALSRK